MADYNGVWALIPQECSNVDPNSATQQGSEGFLEDSWKAYVGGLMPDLVPGIVLGSIAAAGFLFFVGWFFVRWSRKHKIRAAKEAHAKAKAAGLQSGDGVAADPQFISSEAPPGAEEGEEEAQEQQTAQAGCLRRVWQTVTAGRVLKWLIVLLSLATIGVCAWGIAESIQATDDLVSNFWLLVNRVELLVLDFEASLSSLAASLSEMAGTLGSVQGALETVVNTVNSIPVIGGLIGRALPMDKIETFVGETATEAIAQLDSASQLINDTVVPVIQDQVLPALDSVYTNQEWSLQLQDKWRFVVIGILFGLLILFAAAVAVVLFRMNRGMVASLLVAGTWALVALLMFLGLGMLNGAKSVANDACLYTEEYVTRLAAEKLQGNAREIVLNALDYYVGKVDLTDSSGAPLLTPNGTTSCDPELTAALVRQVAGINISSALILAWDAADLLPALGNTLGGLNLPTIPLVNFDLDSILAPVVDASDTLEALLDDVCNITLLLVRENHIWPLYVSAKTFVCCELTSAIHAVWVPWTVAGSLALVLCVLASLRVVTSTLRPVGRAAKRGGKGDGGVEAAVVDGAGGKGGGMEMVDGAGGKGGSVEMVGGGGSADAAGGVAGVAAEP